jgi:hypothetical protein
MTLNDKNDENKSTTEIWTEAYITRTYPDIKSIESFSLHFLSQVNDHNITAELIGNLCIHTFSCFAISSMSSTNSEDTDTEPQKIPVLSLILHPFKEQRSPSFSSRETLFGVILNSSSPKIGVKTIEFNNPLDLFKPGETISIDETLKETTVTPDDPNPTMNTTKKGWILTLLSRIFLVKISSKTREIACISPSITLRKFHHSKIPQAIKTKKLMARKHPHLTTDLARLLH